MIHQLPFNTGPSLKKSDHPAASMTAYETLAAIAAVFTPNHNAFGATKNCCQSWDVSVFRVENRTAPVHAETLELRVDRETHQPVELKRWLVRNGQKSIHHATFVIDYPERGAEDVYALGAPRDVPVLDIREIQRFFVERQWPEPVNYKAIEFWTWTGEHELKNAKNPHRYRHNAAGTMIEQAAFADWMNALSRNGNRKHSIEWWIEKIELAHWET